MEPVSFVPIGLVQSTRKRVEDDRWDQETAYIALDADRFDEEALLGLAEFSRVEVVFNMNQVEAEAVVTEARHPGNNPP